MNQLKLTRNGMQRVNGIQTLKIRYLVNNQNSAPVGEISGLSHFMGGAIGFVSSGTYYGFDSSSAANIISNHTVSIDTYLTNHTYQGSPTSSYTYIKTAFYPSNFRINWTVQKSSSTDVRIAMHVNPTDNDPSSITILDLTMTNVVSLPDYVKFAFSQSSTGVLKTYLNGVLCYDSSLPARTPLSNVTITTDNANQIQTELVTPMSNVSNPFFTFDGMFLKWDNVMVFEQVLTDSEISNLHQGTSISTSPTVRYSYDDGSNIDESTISNVPSSYESGMTYPNTASGQNSDLQAYWYTTNKTDIGITFD